MHSSVVCVFLVCAALFGGAVAQQKSCADSSSLNVTNLQLAGEWFQVARQPASSYSCVDVDFANAGNNMWDVNITYASNPAFMYQNMTVTTNFTVDQNVINAGVNVSFTMDMNGAMSSTPYTVYKVLYMDPAGLYTLICGYTNATDVSTAFGTILTRQREVNATYLSSIEIAASQNFTNFQNGVMTVVPQNASCYTNGAATTTPLLAALMAFFYVAHKLAH